MARTRPIQNHLPILAEMMGKSERAAAIVAGALVENNLVLAILSRLREMNGEKEEKLFGIDEGPFATFHQRIEIGWALNLYSERARLDLSHLKSIRNKFAHDMSVRAFSDKWMADRCAQLSFPSHLAKGQMKAETTDPKNRFMETVDHFVTGLRLISNEPRRPEYPGIISYT